MEFIRDWAYKQMISWETGEPWPPLTILLLGIVILGILLDWLF